MGGQIFKSPGTQVASSAVKFLEFSCFSSVFSILA